jgi:hypothetical protein
MSAFAAFLLALLRALPALEQLVHARLKERAAEREREALRRQAAKDQAVDAAIDNPSGIEGEHGPGV